VLAGAKVCHEERRNKRRIVPREHGSVEAFSDGVIAVAITLLVLDIKVPDPARTAHHLAHELGVQWPSYAAYASSFVTIGIVWINHHAMIGRLREVDHLILNLLLLLCIGVLPFATSLLGTYLKQGQGQGQSLAAAIYSGLCLLMSITFANPSRHILFPKAHMLSVELPVAQRRKILWRGSRVWCPTRSPPRWRPCPHT